MRLLNATTLRLETYVPGTEPPYAILSHRWTDDEVLFDDVQNGTAHTKRGFAKLHGCCVVALREGLSHVWIDTCCIDKSSSAELSEEINSMFRWYSKAKICYAYLRDTTGVQDYLASEWFDRGWTLQELIAPAVVDFYAGDWTKFGSRSLLSPSLSIKTGIAKEYLHGADLRSASIAERMSWAAARKTARPEDMAYCLLGIFNIQMTPIYGEGGEKAFVRLQRELLNQLDDHSYLAWTVPSGAQATVTATTAVSDSLEGLLARSPAAFKNCRDVVLCDRDATTAITPVSMTNVGIHARLPVVQWGEQKLLLLRCRWRRDYWNVITITVAERFGRYYRTSTETITCPEDDWPEEGVSHDILLSPDPYENATALSYAVKPLPPGFRVTDILPNAAWEKHLDTHIRIKSEGSPGSPTRRLVRLQRDTGVDEVQDPNDYILKLDLRFRKGRNRSPVCQLGILPRGCPLSQADEDASLFGTAVSIPGQSAALAAVLKMRPLHGRNTYVVDVFIDEPRKQHSASRSQVLSCLPSQVEDEEESQTDETDETKRKRIFAGRFIVAYVLTIIIIFSFYTIVSSAGWERAAAIIGFVSLVSMTAVVAPSEITPEKKKQIRERIAAREMRRERLRERGYMTF